MTKNKGIRSFEALELLYTFSKQELDDLQHFVSCPYFNTDVYIPALLVALRETMLNDLKREREFDNKVKQKIYIKVFPKKPKPKEALNKKEQNFINVKMSVLTRLITLFFQHEALKKKPATQTSFLSEELLKRGQYRLFNRYITRVQKVSREDKKRGNSYYEQQYQIEAGLLDYYRYSDQLRVIDNIQGVEQNLDICYLFNKLWLHLTAVSLSDVSAKKSYDFEPMKAIEGLLKISEYADLPLIRIYQTAINLLKTNDFAIYQKLLKLLEIHGQSIPQKDARHFYVVASNFCIKSVKEGKPEYYRHLFELYQKMDEQDLLREEEFMPVQKLKNVLGAGRKIGEFKWAMDMVEKYRSFVKKEFRESVYHFNMGAIAFDQKDYKTAIHHFIRVDKINVSYDVNGRMMLLKSHYQTDTGYDDRTIRIYVTAESFIQQNNSLVSNDKKAYKNFIRILINLYKVRHRATKITVERVREKLELCEFVSDKKWLLMKIEELEKEKRRW